MILQQSHVTEMNRYPEIFKEVSEFGNHGKKILSFGCSTGEEVFSLDQYFIHSEIHGVDISQDCINEAKKRQQDNFWNNKISFGEMDEDYDIIFAMSVLCKYPDDPITFNEFYNTVKMLDLKLKTGGLLVIYNSNYRLTDAHLFYESIGEQESGFVPKFGLDNNYIQKPYNHVIFKKNMKQKELYLCLTKSTDKWAFNAHQAMHISGISFWIANGILFFHNDGRLRARLGLFYKIKLWFWLQNAERANIIRKAER